MSIYLAKAALESILIIYFEIDYSAAAFAFSVQSEKLSCKPQIVGIILAKWSSNALNP